MTDWQEILGNEYYKKVLGDKHYKTLKKIFMNPTPSDIPWSDIQGLLEKLRDDLLGGKINVVFGGRIRIKLDNGKRGEIHQADLAGFTAIGNVREIKGVLESTAGKGVIERVGKGVLESAEVRPSWI